ncbi:hypothetical protein NYE37_03855 [Thermoactinomyces sp. FSL K6-2592]|jgi:hypothetical protein|uniref:hypothetical protein n=1 Tax=Thermoactinomyces sp. FSL K6-2592 TaxID=2975347 RepID=UPI0030F632AA
MPVGYSAKCKLCNSMHRAEVERWIKEEGLSLRAASERLKEEHGEKIGHVAISRHMNEHFDVKAEARRQYAKSQAEMSRQVNKKLSEVEMLDNIARENYDLFLAVRAWIGELVEKKGKLPKSAVDLLATTAAEVRQQLKQKAELLGEDTKDDVLADIAEIVASEWTDDE